MIEFLNYFIRRPVAAIVLHAAILVIGLRAIFTLPIVQYPLFESSSLIITTHYVGASAETVRGFVTSPIERAVATISGLDYVESKSTPGMSVVTAKLDLGVDGNRALAEAANRIDQIRSELPADAEPPRVEILRGDRPWATFYLAFTSDTLSLSELSEYVSRDVQSALVGIPGVHKVSPMGEAPRAMRVWIDSSRMAAFGVDASDVSAALERNNYISAVGQAKSDSIAVNLRTDTDLKSETDFQNLIVRQSPAGVVRLSDVARVEMGVEEKLIDTRVDRDQSIYLEVWPLPGVSELAVDTALRERLDELQPSLPPGVEAKLAYAATTYMRDSLVEITKTLAETILIVSLVVFLFLGSIRHATVPLVAVPISIVGTGALMALMGMSLNTLTLLAIVLSIGLVVDDAIVVVENVQRYMRQGKSGVEAALISVRQLAAPLFAMTITLAVVYAPIGFLTGLSGVMLREFAFTLACAVLVSGLVALTLSPVMSGWAGAGQHRTTAVGRATEAAMERVSDIYRKLLDGALAARWPILSVALFLTLLIPVLFTNSARELAPMEDQGEIDFFGSGSAASTIEYMGEGHIDALVDKVEGLPGGDYVWYIAQPQSVVAALMLVPWQERDVSPQELLGPTYAAIAEIPGMQMFPLLPQSLPSGGYFDVEMLVVANASHAELDEQAGKLMEAAMKTGKFMFVDTDIKIDMPVSQIEIDREKVAQLGLDLADVGQTLGTMVGGDYVNRFDYDGRPYKVIPQVEQSARMSNQDLLNLTIRTPVGNLCSARGGRQYRGWRRTAVVEPLPADRQFPHHRRRGARGHEGYRSDGAGGGGCRHPAARLPHRLRWRVAPDQAARQRHRLDGPSRPRADLPRAAAPVRQLARSAGSASRIGAAGACRRADVHFLRRDDDQPLQPGRPYYDGGADCQERHPDRPVRQPPARRGHEQDRRCHRCCHLAPPAGADDHFRDDRRTPAAGVRIGPGVRRAQQHRPHAGLRHGHRHAVHAVRAALRIHGPCAAVPPRRAGTFRNGCTGFAPDGMKTGLRA